MSEESIKRAMADSDDFGKNWVKYTYFPKDNINVDTEMNDNRESKDLIFIEGTNNPAAKQFTINFRISNLTKKEEEKLIDDFWKAAKEVVDKHNDIQSNKDTPEWQLEDWRKNDMLSFQLARKVKEVGHDPRMLKGVINRESRNLFSGFRNVFVILCTEVVTRRNIDMIMQRWAFIYCDGRDIEAANRAAVRMFKNYLWEICETREAREAREAR